jgi:stress response protein SCP2
MKQCRLIFCLFILSELFAVNPVAAQDEQNSGKQGNGISHLIGNWSGESICVNKEKFPACHDEQVVYRLVQSSGKSNMVTVTMAKIVSAKTETMGVFDFVYDAQKQTLSGEFTRNNRHGIWEFEVKGDLMDGTLTTLPDKTIVRRIDVKKDK